MANCAIVGANNVLQLTSDAIENCNGVIVLSAVDYQKFNATWGDFTLQNANELLTAILGLWAVAFVCRALIRQINQNDEVTPNE